MTTGRTPSGAWRVWVDTGGTFTDCLAVDAAGRTHRAKVLSSGALRARVASARQGAVRLEGGWVSRAGALVGATVRTVEFPRREARLNSIDESTGEASLDADLGAQPGDLVEVSTDEPAPTLAARLVTGARVGQPLPEMELRLATTRGTNALLERRTAPTALFVTEGFADLLEIGDQRRPDLFALRIEKARGYAQHVVEVRGRLDAEGDEVRPLDLDKAMEGARRALDAGAQAAAVALAHSWVNPEHERRLCDALREAGFAHVSRSSELAAMIGLLARAQTAVVNAALAPVVGDYLREVASRVPGERVLVMTSAGGVVGSDAYRPMDSLLSGPAGGVVGARAAARASGFERVIAFDMGGTSTDVARIDGGYEYVFAHGVGDARLLAPALAIESVAAGGGSVCRFDVDRPLVGPESAGASPGSACYGAGGPLTITDVNLLLGRLDEGRFETPIDADRARGAFDQELRQSMLPDAARRHPDALLEGFLQIANERMAEAIRRISVRKGYDPSRYALVAFGGAGGQHACAVASLLGMREAIVPRDASLLSAVGLGRAALERSAQRQMLVPLSGREAEVDEALRDLTREAAARLLEEGIDEADIDEPRRIVDLRYRGQGQTLSVECADADTLAEAFERRHREVFGDAPSEREIEVESARVFVSMKDVQDQFESERTKRHEPEPAGTRRMRVGGAWREVPVYDRDALGAGAHIDGPALVVERRSATLVEPGWSCEADGAGALVLRRTGERDNGAGSAPEVVRAELLAHRLSAIAEEMGEALRRAAVSTNVKERLDYSCALLDAKGRVVSAAPHIPVHLGALGVCAQRVLERVAIGPGDVVVTNHPAFGGSHLPDVTLIAGVFTDGGELVGYTASRAHHAEIGGSRPGSMPPSARTLEEEGVVIPPVKVFEGGAPRWERVRALLEGGRYPSRAPEDNIADMRAAVAAGRRGADALRALAQREGLEDVRRAMEMVQDRADTLVRSALSRMGDVEREVEETLDDGSVIRVRFAARDGAGLIDLTGTSPTHPGNLNAPEAVVRSAAAYAMRLLVGEDVPLNDGLLASVELRVPEGSMLRPAFTGEPANDPAVAGGNVETSQRLTNALLRALGLCADSQGTMNNVLFGTPAGGHYETICGGAGAVEGFDGADAVHTHMTNTAITDCEVLERRFPVRVERFGVRRGSGGRGRWRGGDGAVRELVFLAPAALSVLTQHRTAGPRGCEGGGDGAPGAQRVVRASGETLPLASIDGCDMSEGDRLIIETPGGGGWGAATKG